MAFARWWYTIPLRFRSIFWRERVEEELNEELAYHLDQLVKAHVADGLAPAEARRAAFAAMDGLDQRKEECRDARRVHVVEDLIHDLRDACRQFRKAPGFVLVVLVILSLTIGGNTAIFSVARAVFTPMVVPEPDRVVMVWTDNVARDWHQFPASMPDVLDWQASGVFSSLGAFLEDGFNLRLADRTDRVEGFRVSTSFFEALAVPPARGRTFTDRDDADHVVVLSDRLWRAAFDGRPDIVGSSVVLNGSPHTVVGVLAPRFPQTGHEELYAPLLSSTRVSGERGTRNLGVVGRLKPHLSLQAAQRRMDEVSLELARQYPEYDAGATARLQPLNEAWVQDARLLLNLLRGVVACALLIALANVASLLLARGLARRRELAIRTALGGGRGRLTRQLMTEHLLLALLAGAVAVIPASQGLRLVASYHLQDLPNADLATLNPSVLTFNFLVALLTGVLCGLVPAWLVWKSDLSSTLKAAPNVDSGRSHQRLRRIFVVSQIALTVILLVGGGLMVRSFLRLIVESPGYDPQGLLTLRVALSETQYQSSERQVAFFERVIERARGLPGIVAASATEELPTSDDVHGSGMLFPGQPDPRLEDVPLALHNAVLGEYFRVMHVPVLRGRYFTGQDVSDSPLVAIIDEWTANRFWPHQDPIGQRFKLGRKQPWREIVGVVGNVESPIVVRFLKGRVGQVYLPLTQDPHPRMSLVIRSAGDPPAQAAPVRDVVRGVDRDQPVFDIRTMDEVRAAGRAPVRLVAGSLGGFALMALLLAMVGLYGSISYDVGQRTREFGLRMSLGAPRSAVLNLVLWRGAGLLLLGLAIGAAGALASARMLASFLYGVRTSDPLTLACALSLLAASGLLASYLPARRATTVDPTVALRSE
jgi:putative ABC transport system permease protein